MRAKFDKILLPIADVLIAEDQRKHVTFDAFFANTMFHEVAHGHGVKTRISGRGHGAGGSAGSRLGHGGGRGGHPRPLHVARLHEKGELGEAPRLRRTTTSLSWLIFLTVRTADAHGGVNTIRFNFFEQMGAFTRDAGHRGLPHGNSTGCARRWTRSEKLLVLQGDGDYAGAGALIAEMGQAGPQLQAELARRSTRPSSRACRRSGWSSSRPRRPGPPRPGSYSIPSACRPCSKTMSTGMPAG